MASPTWNDARKEFLLENVDGSTSYWTLNDLEYAFAQGGGGGGGELPGPLSTVNTVWLYGASIEDGITHIGLTDRSPGLGAYLSDLVGRTITVVDKGVPSQTLSQIATRFTTDDLAAAQALGNQLLIITMPMGNDISTNRPYPGGAGGITTAYTNLLAAFRNSGAHVMPVNTTFRNYSSGAALMDESIGSLPYNENIIYPLVQSSYFDMWWDGKPWCDPYDIARNWYSIILSDDVHYNQLGYEILGRYWMDSVASRLLGIEPPRVPRVDDPTLSQVKVPLPTGWLVSSGSNVGILSNMVGFQFRGIYSNVADVQCPSIGGDYGGYAPNSITFTSFGASDGFATNSALINTGDESNTLLADRCKSLTIPRSQVDFFKACTWKGLNPNQPVDVDVLSIRSNATADPTRITQFSLDGVAVYGEVNSIILTGAPVPPPITRLSGTASPEGEVSLWFRKKAGSTFGYLNGAVIYPL